MKSFIEEFKTFAVKGNVVDLAVAVVIGGAFGKIVTSLVNNIITPLIGVVLGGIDFSSMSVHIGDAEITYGVFIQSVIDFLIVSLVIFLAIKGISHLQIKKKKEEKQEEVQKPVPEDIQLLREIRDSLRHTH